MNCYKESIKWLEELIDMVRGDEVLARYYKFDSWSELCMTKNVIEIIGEDQFNSLFDYDGDFSQIHKMFRQTDVCYNVVRLKDKNTHVSLCSALDMLIYHWIMSHDNCGLYQVYLHLKNID